jgi:hypothetical protein
MAGLEVAIQLQYICCIVVLHKGIDHSLPLGLEPPTFPRGSVSTCVANLIIQLLNRLDHAHSIMYSNVTSLCTNRGGSLERYQDFIFLTILNLSLRNACHSFPAFSEFPAKPVRL